MTARSTATIVHRLFDEVINTGDLDRADALIAQDYIEHTTPSGTAAVGLAAFKRGAAQVRAAFPDFRATVEDALATDDTVAFRLTMGGTHRGTFAGVAPTGRVVAYSAIGFVRVAGGKIAERWLQIDATGLLRQMGVEVIPAAARPPRPE